MHLPLVLSLISLWSSQPGRDLKSFQWNNRILLIFAPDSADLSLKRQSKLVEANSAGFVERDFRVFIAAENSPAESQLRSRFNVSPNGFVVILIGKDGTEKFRRNAVVEPEQIFQIVDRMPMRREEIRSRSQIQPKG